MRRTARTCRVWRIAATGGAMAAALAGAAPAWGSEPPESPTTEVLALGPGAVVAAAEPASASRLSLSLTEPPPGVNGQDLGLKLRQPLTAQHSVDITAWRRVEPPSAMALIRQREPATYGARIELRIAPARRNGLVADYKFLGLQLDNGGKVTIRRKNGGSALVYRQQF